MRVNNIIITESLDNILNMLKVDLANKEINVFHSIKSGSENIQTTCPFHKGGQERKPSFGIHIETGKCNCFTCGWKGDLFTLISEIHNKYDDGKYGKNWVLKNFSSTEIIERQRPIFDLGRNKKLSQEITTVTEQELQQYRYYSYYMYVRKLSNRIINTFDVGYDINTDCLTFPVYDLENRCVFVARRGVGYKYFNYPKAVNKPVYALVNAIEKGYKKVVITESILNCLTLWKLGIPAVSLMGLGSKSQYELLRNAPIRHYVLALDPDRAGQQAQEKLRKALCKHKVISQIKYTDSNKDINDLDKDYTKLTEIW